MGTGTNHRIMSTLLNPVSSVILAITVIMSIIAFRYPAYMGKWILSPYRMFRGSSYWQLITSGFIHADAGHLFFNMLTFYFFAFPLENIIGAWRFVVLYFACMLISTIPSFLKNRDNPDYASLGASGAVSGVVFGYILYISLSKIYLMFIPIGIPAFIYAFLYLGYCVYAAKKQGGRINHSAHFWGSISGAVITILFDPGVFDVFARSIGNFFQ
jgi:membrane associated rhomboid family serine protease